MSRSRPSGACTTSGPRGSMQPRASARRRRDTDASTERATSSDSWPSANAARIAGFAKSSVPVGRKQRHRVLEVIDDGLERRALAGQLRAIGGEPRGDGLEGIAEVAELRVARQIDVDVELAAAESREAAPDHVDRPEHDLREQHRRPASPTMSATSVVKSGVRSALSTSVRMSSVETPTRIAPDFRRCQHERLAELERLAALRVDRPRLRDRPLRRAVAFRSSAAGSVRPTIDGSLCAITPRLMSMIAA